MRSRGLDALRFKVCIIANPRLIFAEFLGRPCEGGSGPAGAADLERSPSRPGADERDGSVASFQIILRDQFVFARARSHERQKVAGMLVVELHQPDLVAP